MSGYGESTESLLPRTGHCPIELVATNACKKSPGIAPMGLRAAAGVVTTLVVSEVAVERSAAAAAVIVVAAVLVLVVGGLAGLPLSWPLCDSCDGRDGYPTSVVSY